MVGFVYNSFALGANDLVMHLIRSLGLEKRSWVAAAHKVADAAPMMGDTRLVVTVGGDGTILRTATVAAPLGVALVGVNMGRLGFMTELTVDEAPSKLPSYIAGDARAEERVMLHSKVVPVRGERERVVEFHGLNDVVVGRGAVARLVRVRAMVNGNLLAVYRADAMIVSTATGSTGYTLSAGGPVLYPSSRDFVIQPVAPHLGLASGVVLPGDSVVDLVVETDISAMLSVDGYQEFPLLSGDTIRVALSPFTARFLRMHGPDYFLATLFQRLGIPQVPQRPSVS